VHRRIQLARCTQGKVNGGCTECVRVCACVSSAEPAEEGSERVSECDRQQATTTSSNSKTHLISQSTDSRRHGTVLATPMTSARSAPEDSFTVCCYNVTCGGATVSAHAQAHPQVPLACSNNRLTPKHHLKLFDRVTHRSSVSHVPPSYLMKY
jgi:hypothetical protein